MASASGCTESMRRRVARPVPTLPAGLGAAASGRPWRWQDLIGRRTVSCQQRDMDRYGRIVAQCQQDDIDISEWLVGQGLALAYRKYSEAYVAAEETASAAKRRVWAGSFTAPWDWRREHGSCGRERTSR